MQRDRFDLVFWFGFGCGIAGILIPLAVLAEMVFWH
jgi:hypothetical protein